MLKILKSSVRDTVIYSIGTFASKLSGLILVPLYTDRQYLSSKDYGVLNLVEANLQMVISIFGLGLCYAYERWYWDKEQIDKRKSLFYSVIIASILISILVVSFLLPFSQFFSSVLFDDSAYHFIFKLMLINAGLEIIAQTPNSLIRLSEKPGLFTIANLSKLFVSVMLTIFFLANLDLGLEGVYYAQFGGIIVYFLVLAPFIFKNMETRFEWRELKNMVYFRFPFLLPIIALNLFQYNDRFLLTKIIDLDNAGIYSLGTKLANTIKTFLITAIWLALTPTIYKMMDKPGNKRFYAKLMTYLTFAITIVVMIFSFYSKEIVSLIAEDAIYLQAYKVMPLISLSILFAMLKDISLIGLNITKKTKPIAWVTIGVSALNIALNFFLIKELGMNGAALAILVSQFVFFIVIHRIAQTHYPIPYELNKVFVMIAVAITLYVAALAIQDITFWLAFAIKAMLIAAFPLILHFFNFYEPVELERLKGFWKKWRNPLSWVRNIQTLDF